MIRALITQSAGITGRVTWLLGRAAEIAIQDGSEVIDAAIVECGTFGDQNASSALPATRLLHPLVADRLVILGQLSDTERTDLWSPQSDWELNDQSFCTFCPHCCLADLANNRAPYGRRVWQQSWCTVCKPYGTALTLRNLTHAPKSRSCWSHANLKSNREFLAANR